MRLVTLVIVLLQHPKFGLSYTSVHFLVNFGIWYVWVGDDCDKLCCEASENAAERWAEEVRGGHSAPTSRSFHTAESGHFAGQVPAEKESPPK